jgi:hypothetical protein
VDKVEVGVTETVSAIVKQAGGHCELFMGSLQGMHQPWRKTYELCNF